VAFHRLSPLWLLLDSAGRGIPCSSFISEVLSGFSLAFMAFGVAFLPLT
jgi:hypothetical protein